MTRLVWGETGNRYFETGTDRGVLYPKNSVGVPWNGLTAVSESPSGADPRPYYFDGFKYLNLATAEEYEATIEAFSAPEEFGRCDGSYQIRNGLFITQQPRESFHFSYRTLVGNDIDATDHGYKIHLVYNALAGPAERAHVTLNDSPEAMKLSWSITTAPPPITGFKPSAHFVIDSRRTPKVLMDLIEGMLYGSPSSNASIPSVAQLMAMFDSYLNIRIEVTDQPDAYNAFTVDDITTATAIVSNTVPPASADGSPILWLDTSAPGFAQLKLVTGD